MLLKEFRSASISQAFWDLDEWFCENSQYKMIDYYLIKGGIIVEYMILS
jgi:hypothetical protein